MKNLELSDLSLLNRHEYNKVNIIIRVSQKLYNKRIIKK